MRYLPMRLLGFVIILVSAGITYYNWQKILNDGMYSINMAIFGPVGVIGGLFVLLFPSKGGRPTTGRDQFLVLFVFGIGVVAGLYNWYMMDPGYFGR